MQTVHVRVNDAATGKPTPCRVRFTDERGGYYPPLGRLALTGLEPLYLVGGNAILDGKSYAYIDGACEVPLPSGKLFVEIDKGPEYHPIREEIQLAQGKLSLRFELKRFVDSRANGWYSGDSVYFLSPHAALLEGAGEDVAFINLLITPHYLDVHREVLENIEAFSGQRPCLETDGHQVFVNTLNRGASLQDLELLNCHRVVYPLFFAILDRTYSWTLEDWADQCHRKGGLVVACGEPKKETLSLLVVEKIDALNVAHDVKPRLNDWYILQNAGIRVPLFASTHRKRRGVNVGQTRTYAHVDGTTVSYEAWIEAVRRGRTFITNGPQLYLTVNGEKPGAVVAAPNVLHVRAEVHCLDAIEQVEILLNGDVVGQARPAAQDHHCVLECDLDSDSPGWIAARCMGPRFQAHTSPVFVEAPGASRFPRPDALKQITRRLAEARIWFQEFAKFDTDKRREHVLATLDQAEAKLRATAI